MRRCWIVSCALVVLCTSAHAQLSDPTSLPANLGKRTYYRALPKVWIRIRFDTQDRSANAAARVTTIELLTKSDRERLLAQKVFRAPSDVAVLAPHGTLDLDAAPTIQPIVLRFTISTSDGAVLRTYERSYRLQFPDEARMSALGPVRALEESGYLGDFAVDRARGEVVRTDTGG